MKLSELVSFRNRLNLLPTSRAKEAANLKLHDIMHVIEQPLEKPLEDLTIPFMSKIESCYADIQEKFEEFDKVIAEVKDTIQQQIAEQEKQFFLESYKLFEEARTCETNEQILYGRRNNKTDELVSDSELTLRARLSSYADWRFAGMIIRPGVENFIDDMVGCDPLYVIDQNYDLLRPALEKFPKLYQNRLRPYVINDWSDAPILDKIPNNQFGVCLAYNVFNYRPLEIIRRYLEEIYSKLRPGGYLLMSFNDCDYEKAVVLVENHFASYTPGFLIRNLAESIGFTITYSWSDGGPNVWMELRKQGQLESLRGGQTTAWIRRQTDYLEDLDYLKRRAYNKEEIDDLYQQATDFEVDKETINSFKPYELEQHLNELRYKKYQESLIKLEEEKAAFAETERLRLFELHEQARSLGITPEDQPNEQEISRLIYEALDKRKKDELRLLRQRAMELNAGDPNLIKYGYSAEKLKQLIKEKEEEQK